MKHKENRLPIFTQRFRALQGERSNTEFADFLGLSRQTVGFYCNGDRLPDVITLLQIAEKCDVSTDYLLGKDDIPSASIDIRAICDYTGLGLTSINELNWISRCEDTWGRTGKKLLQALDRMIASIYFFGFIAQFDDYYIAQEKYLKRKAAFAEKYSYGKNDKPTDIMKVASGCVLSESSPLNAEGTELVKLQDNADFEMYRLQWTTRLMAEDCSKER